MRVRAGCGAIGPGKLANISTRARVDSDPGANCRSENCRNTIEGSDASCQPWNPGQRRSDYKAGAPVLNISGDDWAGLTGATGMLVLGLLAPLRCSFAQIPWKIPAASR